MKLSKKVARLKGLAEGLEISAGSKNGKIIKGILEILEDMADSIKALEDKTEELDEYIAEIDEDLETLEDEFEQTCGKTLHEDEDGDEEDDDEDEEKESADSELLDGVIELKCPYCKEHILIDSDDILNSDDMTVDCPECGREIEVINEEAGGYSCPGCRSRFDEDEDDEDEIDDEEDDDEVPEF